jgi:hypothetical protein
LRHRFPIFSGDRGDKWLSAVGYRLSAKPLADS